MSKRSKAESRILSLPKDYTYTEAKSLLSHKGFTEYNKGKTSGSRVKFYREKDGKIIMLHKPHPQDIMDMGALKSLVKFLKEINEL